MKFSMLVLTGILTLICSLANSDSEILLKGEDLLDLLVGKTIHMRNPRAKIYFSSHSSAIHVPMSGNHYGQSEVIYWYLDGDQFCYTDKRYDGELSCISITQLTSGNYRVSVTRKDRTTDFYLPKNEIVSGIDL